MSAVLDVCSVSFRKGEPRTRALAINNVGDQVNETVSNKNSLSHQSHASQECSHVWYTHKAGGEGFCCVSHWYAWMFQPMSQGPPRDFSLSEPAPDPLRARCGSILTSLENLELDLQRVACGHSARAVGSFQPAVTLESTGRSKWESISEMVSFHKELYGKD